MADPFFWERKEGVLANIGISDIVSLYGSTNATH